MNNKTESWESTVPQSSSETLCSNLAQGLHAAAQPLTVLRASLDSSIADRMGLDEFRLLMENSALEVERVCRFFTCLREFVTIESIKPKLSTVQILPLLVQVADGLNQLFGKNGILLCSRMPQTCEAVLINKGRTLHALTSVLLIAHGVSHVQDTVELIATSTSSGTVLIVVQNQKTNIDALSAEASVNMALAEANMRSQKADFNFSMRPFRVQMELKEALALHSC